MPLTSSLCDITIKEARQRGHIERTLKPHLKFEKSAYSRIHTQLPSLHHCISQLPPGGQPNTHNLKERFNVTHVLGRVSPWLTGSRPETSMVEGHAPEQSCLVHGSWEAEQGYSAKAEGAKDQRETPRPPRHTQKCFPLITLLDPKADQDAILH